MSVYSLWCSTAPSKKAAQVITVPQPSTSCCRAEHQEENHQHIISPCACDPREVHSPVQLPCSFSQCRQNWKNQTGQSTSKMISVLPSNVRTPVFHKSGLPQGFDSSAVSPLAFRDPIHALARASTCPDCVCHKCCPGHWNPKEPFPGRVLSEHLDLV